MYCVVHISRSETYKKAFQVGFRKNLASQCYHGSRSTEQTITFMQCEWATTDFDRWKKASNARRTKKINLAKHSLILCFGQQNTLAIIVYFLWHRILSCSYYYSGFLLIYKSGYWYSTNPSFIHEYLWYAKWLLCPKIRSKIIVLDWCQKSQLFKA